MKFLIVPVLICLVPLLGCSSLSSRTDYRISKAEDVQSICTIWNSTDGAALTSLSGAQVLIKPPSLKRTYLAGPLLIPFIPVHFSEDLIEAGVEVQVVPPSGESVTLPLSKVETHFDGRKIDFQAASYRVKGRSNQEVTFGSLEKEKLPQEVKIDGPYAISLSGSHQPFPEQIDVTLTLMKGNESQTKTLRFRKEKSTLYEPIIIPVMELDSVCKTTIPEKGNQRSLL